MWLATVWVYGIEISPRSERIALLPHVRIHYDAAHTTTIQTVDRKPFVSTNQTHIGLGYSPETTVWLRIDLRNPTDQPLKRILEYTYPLVTDLKLYEAQSHTLVGQEGLLHRRADRQTLTPYFLLTLPPHTTTTYYLKASTTKTALVLQLDLWKPLAFYNHALLMRSLFAFFIGAMLIIVSYNLIIFFLTRQISYLYYVLFFASVSLHQAVYHGAIALFLSPAAIRVLIWHVGFIVAIPVLLLMLFTREILEIQNHPRLQRLFNGVIGLYALGIITIHLIDLDSLRAPLTIGALFVLFGFALYALYRRNAQAKYIVLGWALFALASLLMYLANIGTYDVIGSAPCFAEWALVLEALIFAFSLAIRIRTVHRDKLQAQHRLIALQAREEQRLTQEVAHRTRQLSQLLAEKDLLLRELNHRVKNSIQIIVSFVRLQIDTTPTKTTRRALTQIENRILSIHHLYALLDARKNPGYVDAHDYFQRLASMLHESFPNRSIEVVIDSEIELPAQTAVYCGFIVNEALTNAFQHAFDDAERGRITLTLSRKPDRLYRLTIQDDGKGLDTTRSSEDGLGLTILESLATLQLKGTLKIESAAGTLITVEWEEPNA